MRRTLVQFGEDTYRRLRRRAFREERSISALVRDMVATGRPSPRSSGPPGASSVWWTVSAFSS
ncbi:MAG: hypothetical protein A3H29_03665 [Acidobacteria bacterium RIFCSPLOWO2_02_FULL_67_21]|nr:MAG: hypothetical protein A3H29_03665 [Acidobacteria bacterium RIFCSPLOWO2_02_FULL_67_21]